jgi:hypothetical protein
MDMTVPDLRSACLAELALVPDSCLPALLRQVRLARGRVPKPQTGRLGELPKTGPLAGPICPKP